MRKLLRLCFSRRTLVSFYNLWIRVFEIFAESFSLSLVMPGTDDAGAGAAVSAVPPFDPSKPSAPISFPIKTLQDLWSRSYFDSFHFQFNRCSVPLRRNSGGLPDRQRLLVCHDMRGGYIDDKWVQGSENNAAYAIWHWYLIDIFVYFSHSLVTLPPPSWTNTAHRHGVKVLGTFITEWEEGKAVCKELLATKESALIYAERLAELASALGFDGWLINIENEIDERQIPNLKEFLAHLTKIMHLSDPGALVIWYDSVTYQGHLEWQDQLNEMNKPFFDICDGIFMNYTWKEDYPKLSGEASGDRQYDVYMGIDVFGRNSFGGGQWTSNVALDVIKKNKVSAAIFAPGWVYETDQPPDFLTAQNRWWSLVEKSWGVLQTYPQALPFYSDFDRGFGNHLWLEGSELSDAAWYNLSCQSLQPLLEFNEEDDPNIIRVTVNAREASYNGGGNVTFKGRLEEDSHFVARLFKPDLRLSDSSIFIAFSAKADENSGLGILLRFSSPSQDTKLILIASRKPEKHICGSDGTVVTWIDATSSSSRMLSGWTIHGTSIVLENHTLSEISALCFRPNNTTKAETLSQSEYLALLGHISIDDHPRRQRTEVFPPASSWVIEASHVEIVPGESGSRVFGGQLGWKLRCLEDRFVFRRYNVYVEKVKEAEIIESRKLLEDGRMERVFLGTAHVDAFYVSGLVVEPVVKKVRFVVQAWSEDDSSWQQLDASPNLLVDLD